jgi:hypothetical protein
MLFCVYVLFLLNAYIYIYIYTHIPPPDGIPTLTQWRGLRGHMNPRAMLAVAYATGRASHARQVKGNDPDKKGPPGWGLGIGLTTPHHENNLFRNPRINLRRMRNKCGRKKLVKWT